MLSLPTEVRLRILEYVFLPAELSNDDFKYTLHVQCCPLAKKSTDIKRRQHPRHILPLLLSHRRLKDESLYVLALRFTFALDVDGLFGSENDDAMPWFVHALPRTMCGMLRRIAIKVVASIVGSSPDQRFYQVYGSSTDWPERMLRALPSLQRVQVLVFFQTKHRGIQVDVSESADAFMWALKPLRDVERLELIVWSGLYPSELPQEKEVLQLTCERIQEDGWKAQPSMDVYNARRISAPVRTGLKRWEPGFRGFECIGAMRPASAD